MVHWLIRQIPFDLKTSPDPIHKKLWEKANQNGDVSPQGFGSYVEGLEKVMLDSHLGFIMNGEEIDEVFTKRYCGSFSINVCSL